MIRKESLTKAKALILKYWWVIAGVILVAVGFFVGRGRRGGLREWRRVQTKISEVEERKEARITEIEEEREERIREIEVEHVETIENLKEEQREEYEEVRHDPKKLNRMLNSLLPK